jgi:hypothetical protein
VTDFLRRNPLILGLVILCSLLAVVIAVEFVTLGAPQAPPAPGKVVPSEAKLLPSVAAVSLDTAYPETSARPLWIPTRRPAPVAVVAQPSFQRGQFILQGVTIAGSTRIAMLKEKASGRMHRVELGRDVNGLHVAEVEAERVTLAQGAEREVIELRVQRPGGAPAPGAPPGAPAPQPPAPQPNPAAAAVAPRGAGPFAAPPPPPAAPTPAPPVPGGPVPANPTAGAVPQQQLYVPMTPEELLARRRARRNPSTE